MRNPYKPGDRVYHHGVGNKMKTMWHFVNQVGTVLRVFKGNKNGDTEDVKYPRTIVVVRIIGKNPEHRINTYDIYFYPHELKFDALEGLAAL